MLLQQTPTMNIILKQVLLEQTGILSLNMTNIALKRAHINKIQADITLMINTGQKQEVTEKLHQDTIHTTNMETKQAVLKQTQTAQLLNMINTETKQVHLKLIQAEKQFTTISTEEK